MKFKRGIILVIDACGVGELPDAADYGDIGSSTIPNVARAVGGLNMPNCQKLGLGNIVEIEGVPAAEKPWGSFGKMAERAAGKDSTSGHWEMAGVVIENPFPTFPDGFPKELVERFEKEANERTIGNVAASGTEIIEQLGKEHLQSGAIILYTSADSVFQLAAHEDIISVKRLYEICAIARQMLSGKYAVGRVIARPFVGEPGNFRRTSGRRDFSLEPPDDTILDLLNESNRSIL
ncbi:MAG: phosphopentomutase, partial [candidate division Zixibacteria bacterium]